MIKAHHHGSSSLCRSGDLDGFITAFICEPSRFDISASVSVYSFDTELHERTVSLTQSDLIMIAVPNVSSTRILRWMSNSSL